MTAQVIFDNWTIYWDEAAGSNSGYKQLRWTGSVGSTTINDLYSQVMHFVNDPSTALAVSASAVTTPMRAVTPTVYEIGSFDAGDDEPWFIDPESIKHLTGGALTTIGWTRNPLIGDGTGTVGIIKIAYSVGGGTDLASSDVGRTIADGTNGDSGRLLYFETNGSNGTMWIRPDSNTAADNWDNSPSNTNIDVTGGTGANLTQSSAATTGENIWSNIFTLGTISDHTRLYIAQDNTLIDNSEDSGADAWWGDGQIDVLILTTEQDVLIDNGWLTVYARQYSESYSHFITDVSAGGRTPIPLSTVEDRNNTSGIRTLNVSSASTAFTVDERIFGASSGAIAIVTANTGDPSTSIEYYLVGDLTDFTDTETLIRENSSTNGTVNGTPAATGPANYSDVTITFGLNTTFDIDGDTTNEDYSVVINCNNRPLSEVYERLKYITRRGETSSLDGIQGQQYIGIDNRVDYTSITGTIADGSTVTQLLSDGSTLTAEVVAHNTTDDYVMLRDTRGGTLETGTGAANLQIDGSNFITMSSGATVEVVSPIVVSPFAIFAGGTMFTARGVVLDNVPTADKNNYFVIDNGGTQRAEPATTTFEITNARAGTEIRLYTDDGTRTELGTGIEDSIETVTAFTVVNGGSGYTNGDTLTVNGGTGTSAQGTATVSAGVVTSIAVSNAGSYTARPAEVNQNEMTGGTGTGVTARIDFASTPFTFSYDYQNDDPFNGADVAAYAVVHNINHPYIFLDNITLSNVDQSIPVQQQTERVYRNP